MKRARLWFRGWFFWIRAIYMVRTKKHGKGAMPWPMALTMAKAARFIVYGQHYYKPAIAPTTGQTAGNVTSHQSDRKL